MEEISMKERKAVIKLINPETGSGMELSIIIDERFTYPCIPEKLVEKLNLKKLTRSIIMLPTGEEIKAWLAEAIVEFRGRRATMYIRLSDEIDKPRAGYMTFEKLGFSREELIELLEGEGSTSS